MRKALMTGLAALAVGGVAPGTAGAATVIGSLNLPSGGLASICGGASCTVFQGQVAPASSGSYTLSSPVDGTIVSWSYRNGNAAAGKVYELRVLRPIDAGQTRFAAVASSVAPAIPDGSDAVRGPYPVAINVNAGDRIGLKSLGPNEFGVPLFLSGQNDPMTGDGVRYIAPDVADGSIATPTSAGNTGQQVLVQATIASPPPAPTLTDLALKRTTFKALAVDPNGPDKRILIGPGATNSSAYGLKKLGTTIRYKLSQDATVTFTVEERHPCAKHRAKPRACFRYTQFGRAFTVTGWRYGHQGSDQVGWLGRVTRRIARKVRVVRLQPGSYRLRVSASNAYGQSAPALARFTIVP